MLSIFFSGQLVVLYIGVLSWQFYKKKSKYNKKYKKIIKYDNNNMIKNRKY